MTWTPRIFANCAMPPDSRVRMDSFQVRSLRHINAGRAEDDAATLGFARGGDGVGRVQQRLGRDAAPVQADAAQALVALDQDDFLAEVRRVKGRGITARPRAHNYDFSLNWFHGNSMHVEYGVMRHRARRILDQLRLISSHRLL